MSIPDRSRDKNGEWREKRADTKVENLKADYPEFRHINGNMHLGTLKDKFGVESLDAVRCALREEQ